MPTLAQVEIGLQHINDVQELIDWRDIPGIYDQRGALNGILTRVRTDLLHSSATREATELRNRNPSNARLHD